MLNVDIKLLSDTAKIPTQGSEMAAGYDLYADNSSPITIYPGTCALIPTGLSITPPPQMFGAIFARSGLALKNGLRPANCVGVCDEDYTGQYMVALYNDSRDYKVVHGGDRIAQLVFLPYAQVNFNIVDELKPTERGDGGFGHSGE